MSTKKEELNLDDLDRDIEDMFGDTVRGPSIDNTIKEMLPSEPQDVRNKLNTKSSEVKIPTANNVDFDASSFVDITPAESGNDNFPKKRRDTKMEKGSTTPGQKIDEVKVKIQQQVLQTKMSVVQGIKEIKSMDKEEVKAKFDEAKKFADKAQTLLKQSPGILKSQEPELETKSFWPMMKQILFWIIVFSIVIYTLSTNLSKIGTEKSQEVSILKHIELQYNITGGGLYKLIPLHFFTTFNRNEVIMRMECLVNQRTDACNLYEERKCEVNGLKNPEYDDCMLNQFGLAGYELQDFCNAHYNESSTKIWTRAEAQSNLYLNQKYDCLTNAGVTKGQSFCQDERRIEGLSELEMYDCYLKNGVANSTFGDKRCNLLHFKRSADPIIRDQYSVCMRESGIGVESDQKFVCDNLNPWWRDDYLISQCESAMDLDSLASTLVLPEFQAPVVDLTIPVPDSDGGFIEDLGDFFATGDLSSFDSAESNPFGGFRRRRNLQRKLQFGDFGIPTTTFDTSAFDPANIEATLDLPILDLADLEAALDPANLEATLEGLFEAVEFIPEFNPFDVLEETNEFETLNFNYPGYIPSQTQLRINEQVAKIQAQALAQFEVELAAAIAAIPPAPAPSSNSNDPFAAFIEDVGEFFGVPGEEDIVIPETVLPVFQPPSWDTIMSQIDTSSDISFNYAAPVQLEETKAIYGKINPIDDSTMKATIEGYKSACTKYFQAGLNTATCYEQNVVKWDTDTCNTFVFNQYVAQQLATGGREFNPPPEMYFECYFDKTRMRDTEEFLPEKKEACENLYKDQRDLLNCYTLIGIEITFQDQMKICTNKYQLQSQMDKLYLCLQEFEVERSIDYCNLNPSKNILDLSNDDMVRINYKTLNKLPYFECLEETQIHLDEGKRTDARFCTADHGLYNKYEMQAKEDSPDLYRLYTEQREAQMKSMSLPTDNGRDFLSKWLNKDKCSVPWSEKDNNCCTNPEKQGDHQACQEGFTLVQSTTECSPAKPEPLRAIMDLSAKYTAESYFTEDWKNPRLDSITGFHGEQNIAKPEGPGGSKFAWWQVTLPAIYEASSMTLAKRGDTCCSERTILDVRFSFSTDGGLTWKDHEDGKWYKTGSLVTDSNDVFRKFDINPPIVGNAFRIHSDIDHASAPVMHGRFDLWVVHTDGYQHDGLPMYNFQCVDPNPDLSRQYTQPDPTKCWESTDGKYNESCKALQSEGVCLDAHRIEWIEPEPVKVEHGEHDRSKCLLRGSFHQFGSGLIWNWLNAGEDTPDKGMRDIEFTSNQQVKWNGGGEQGYWKLLDDNTIESEFGGLKQVLKQNENDLNEWVLIEPARDPATIMRLKVDVEANNNDACCTSGTAQCKDEFIPDLTEDVCYDEGIFKAYTYKCLEPAKETVQIDPSTIEKQFNCYEIQPSLTLPQIDYDDMKGCLGFFQMPPSSVEETVCRKRLIPDGGDYVTTYQACTDRFDEICYDYIGQVFKTEDCNQIYESLYRPSGSRDKFEENFAVQCRRVLIDYRPYEACVNEIDMTDSLEVMNSHKQRKLGESTKAITKIDNSTLEDYCEVMFKEQNPYDYVECMKYIGKPLGVEECFFLPEYIYLDKVNIFNYYQKYLCLTFKETVLDNDVDFCITGGQYLYPGYDMNVVEINECLKNYENEPNTKMEIKNVGDFSIYKRVKVKEGSGQGQSQAELFAEEEIKYVEVKDSISTLNEDQLQKFLCEDYMSLNFTTTPFQKVVDFRKKNYNSLRFRMACKTFTQFNGTHNNTVAHFQFPLENRGVNLESSSLFDDTYNETFMLVKRTDTNQQQFNLTFEESLNFLQVESHYVSFYDSHDPVLIADGDQFMQFTTHPNTSTVLSTDTFIVSDQTSKVTNIKAEPLKILEIGKIVVRRILGVGIQYRDVIQKKLDFKKVDDIVPTLDKEDLNPRERRASGQSFIVNLLVDFSEQTIEYRFFTFGDILGKLGGLLATYNSIMGSYAVIAIILYVYSFAQMTKRKDEQEIRKIEIKQYLQHIPDIQDSIKEQITDEGGKLQQALIAEYAKISDALILETSTYNETQLKLEMLQEILKKYYPAGLTDLFSKDSCANEWEVLQVYELEKKHAYLKQKSSLSWGEVIDDIQARLSIYGIYSLKDKHELEQIKTEQQNQQLQNANKRLSLLEKKKT